MERKLDEVSRPKQRDNADKTSKSLNLKLHLKQERGKEGRSKLLEGGKEDRISLVVYRTKWRVSHREKNETERKNHQKAWLVRTNQ
jgi:hypothetical protein